MLKTVSWAIVWASMHSLFLLRNISQTTWLADSVSWLRVKIDIIQQFSCCISTRVPFLSPCSQLPFFNLMFPGSYPFEATRLFTSCYPHHNHKAAPFISMQGPNRYAISMSVALPYLPFFMPCHIYKDVNAIKRDCNQNCICLSDSKRQVQY